MLPEVGSVWLLRLLRDIQLAQFYQPILEELNVTRPEHFDFVRPEDLDGIGMGRPAQRRLAEALKKHRSGLKSKNWVYKILGGFAPEQKETTPPSDNTQSLPEPEGGLKCLIPDSAVCRGELLGSGCFGVVHRGLWTLPSGQSVPVAVKSLRVGPEGPMGTELGDFLREVSIMMNLEHPHVLRLHGLVLGQPLQMVMELAPLGSLHARLTAPPPTPPLPVALLCLFLRQLAGAMAYLGARGLVHRDLATRNLLLASPRIIKVADFGLVRPLGGARGRYVMGGPRPIPFAWCAPESLRHGLFSSASDVWMFGVTLWEMFSGGEEPWAGVPPYLILQRLEKDRARLPRPPLCSRALYALALRCWAPHPADRPSFSHLEGLLQEPRLCNLEGPEWSHIQSGQLPSLGSDAGRLGGLASHPSSPQRLSCPGRTSPGKHRWGQSEGKASGSPSSPGPEKGCAPAEDERHFQESGIGSVPGSPPHRRWFQPTGTSTCQSCAPGTSRPATPPSLCLRLFSAQSDPQGAASLAQKRTPPQSPHGHARSQQSHRPLWRPLTRLRVSEEDYGGGAERAWSHPPGMPGSTEGYWGRCGFCHPEPQGRPALPPK
nr:non-receptor tyrosine-protein kinase TNK1 isoform X3 [Equus asinus]